MRIVAQVDKSVVLADFLRSRRAQVTPRNSGVSVGGRGRRVRGLRREEVAALAGISVDYYTKLERGKVTGVSASVFEGLARALALDDSERIYLAALLNVPGSTAVPAVGPVAPQVPVSVHRVLTSMAGIPAYVRNDRFEILAANSMAKALYAPQFANPTRPVNTIRYLFLEPEATEFFPDWDSIADQAVSFLRASATLDPSDAALAGLIHQLSTRSQAFRDKWADHQVRLHHVGTKRFMHPVVGELVLDFQAFEVDGQRGMRLNTYTAAPETVTAERLVLLASWAATSTDEREPASP